MKKQDFIEKLKEKVESGELQFGFNKQIKEFTLDTYEKKDENTVKCFCQYIEDGKRFQKYYELSVNIEEEQEDWKCVQYRMEDEGFHYCFANYSNWPEIKDKKFHELRMNYLNAAKSLEDYINEKVKGFENE